MLEGIKNIFRKKESNTSMEDNKFKRALYSQLHQNNLSFYADDVDVYIQKGYNINPHVHSVVKYIARSLSSVPFYLYEEKDTRAMRMHKSLQSQGKIEHSNLFQKKALEVVEGHALNGFFEQPNHFQSFSEFLYESIAYKMLTGNNFLYGVNAVGLDMMSEVYNMPSQLVEITEGDWLQPVKGYTLSLDASKIELECDHVAHRKECNLSEDGTGRSLYGLSPISPLLKTVQRSNESYDASISLMSNGAPAGILSNEQDFAMQPEELKELEKAYKKKFGGGSNKNKVMFASTKLGWQSIGMSAVDLQILESNNYDLRDVCRVFGVPSVLVSDNEKSSYNNIVEAEKRFWQNVAIPELTNFAETLNKWLLPKWSEFFGKKYVVDFDLSGVGALQTDLDKLSARLITELQHGIITPNEYRELTGREVGMSEHLDEYYKTSSLMKVNETQEVEQENTNNNDDNEE